MADHSDSDRRLFADGRLRVKRDYRRPVILIRASHSVVGPIASASDVHGSAILVGRQDTRRARLIDVCGPSDDIVVRYLRWIERCLALRSHVRDGHHVSRLLACLTFIDRTRGRYSTIADEGLKRSAVSTRTGTQEVRNAYRFTSSLMVNILIYLVLNVVRSAAEHVLEIAIRLRTTVERQ